MFTFAWPTPAHRPRRANEAPPTAASVRPRTTAYARERHAGFSVGPRPVLPTGTRACRRRVPHPAYPPDLSRTGCRRRRTADRPVRAGVRQRSESLDPDRDVVAVLREHRRVAVEADAGRRAGEEQGVRIERERPTAERDEFADARDEVRRRAVLQPLAVDLRPDVQVVRVGNLVRRDQLRPDGCERVEVPLPDPLAVAVLAVAGRHVGLDEGARDVLERLHPLHAPGFPPDHRGGRGRDRPGSPPRPNAERTGPLVTDVVHAARGRRLALGHDDAPGETRGALEEFILDSLHAAPQ